MINLVARATQATRASLPLS